MSHSSLESEADDPQYFRNYYAHLDPGTVAVIENLKQQAKKQKRAEYDGNYYKKSPDRGYDDHDNYGGRHQTPTNFVAFNEEDYEKQAAQPKPKFDNGGQLSQAEQPMTNQEDVPRSNGIGEEAPAEVQDEAFLNKFFGKAGGYDAAKDRRSLDPAHESGAESESSERSQAPKPSVWKRAGNFFKGLGHAIKMPYNLIRHGLVGANYNRWQMNRHADKDLAAQAELSAMNNPEGLAERKQAMGHEGFTARANALHAKAFSANKKSSMAGLGLVRNRLHYTGTHVAQNFSKAFSKKGDGIDPYNHRRLAKVIGAGVRNVALPSEWDVRD